MEIKKRLEFKNRNIARYKSDFTGDRERVYTSFKFDLNTQYKGLCLCEYPNGDKHFVIRFRLKGQREKPRVFSLGKFNPTELPITGETTFGTKQCSERMFKIVKEHCDEKGKWVKDPNQTIVYNAVNKDITIRKLIELWCKKGFQKMETAESFTGNSIRDKCRWFIGYNWRVKHLEYDNKPNGDGFVRFKEFKKKNKPGPEDWNQLFKWYPAGKFILHDHWFNRYEVKSIYDHDLSKINIEDLRTKLITNFIQQFQSHSARYDVIECFRLLWKFAISEGFMEPNVRIDPTYNVPNKRERRIPYKYRLKVFSDYQMEILNDVCDELSSKFPWQSDAIILMAITGLRKEECFKIKKEDIDWKAREIILNPGITKPGREEFIPFNPPIERCLNNILDIGKRTFTYTSVKRIQKSYRHYPLSYYATIPWLFATTQVNQEKLLNDDYRNSSKTRLRSIKHCWDEMKKQMKIRLGIGEEEEFLCVSKMLRKTFTHKCKLALDGRSDIAKRHTRHKDERVLEGDYDGSTRAEHHESAQKIAKVFDFVKRRKAS